MWSPSVMSLAHLRRSSGDPSLMDYGAIADPGGPAIEVRGRNPLLGRRRLVAVFTIALAADFWMRFALVRTQEDQGASPTPLSGGESAIHALSPFGHRVAFVPGLSESCGRPTSTSGATTTPEPLPAWPGSTRISLAGMGRHGPKQPRRGPNYATASIPLGRSPPVASARDYKRDWRTSASNTAGVTSAVGNTRPNATPSSRLWLSCPTRIASERSTPIEPSSWPYLRLSLRRQAPSAKNSLGSCWNESWWTTEK
jgi:hypothetical protein